MAYTTDRYNPFMRKRDDRKDLLRDAEDAFYGGGQAQPAPTPTPTPKPNRITQFLDAIPQRALIAGNITNAAIQNARAASVKPTIETDEMGKLKGGIVQNPSVYGEDYLWATPEGIQGLYNEHYGSAQFSTNAAGRVRRGNGLLNDPSFQYSGGSQYIGRGGSVLGPQYDNRGNVNPLPKGAVGIQGSQNDNAFNRSLNGSQPTPGATPTTQSDWHIRMANDLSSRSLAAAGSLLGAPQENTAPSLYPQRPASYPITPEGNINFNVPGGSMEDALSRYGGSTYTGGDPSVGALDNATRSQNDQGQDVINTPSGGRIISGVGTDELTAAGIRPGRYADAASPISRSGTGYSYITASGSKVDIAGPPPDQERRRDQGYGSAYGY